MVSPRVSLVELTHDVARRAIRHDMRVPITNIGRQVESVRGTFRDHPETLNSVTNPTMVLQLAESIGPKTKKLYDDMSALEDRLGRDASFTAESAAAELIRTLHGSAAEIDTACRQLATLLKGDLPDLASFGAAAVSNAALLSSKLKALIAFFQLDFTRSPRTTVDLGRMARDTAMATFTAIDAPSHTGIVSRHFSETFSVEGLGEIQANAPLLQAVFQNIYQNALKYGRNVSRLSIKTSIRSGAFADLTEKIRITERPASSSALWHRIEISNNGPPIPAKKKSTIFKLGKKFDVPGVDVEESYGMGMSICFIAATAHKGAIVIDETSSEVKFVVLLPAGERHGFSDTQLLKLAEEISIV